MKDQDHLTKARRIEGSIGRLDKENDWELIVEGIYGAAQHYVSFICQDKIGEHHDTHKGLIKFLRDNNLDELANKFQRLDELRIGKWYGNQANGETVDLALEALKEIKIPTAPRGGVFLKFQIPSIVHWQCNPSIASDGVFETNKGYDRRC